MAGAPVLNFVDTVTQSLWNGLVLSETPVSLAKLKLVADAAYARCDAKDGLKDGLIDDPRRCDFDPARDVAQCPAGQDGDDCLTPAQSRGGQEDPRRRCRSNGKPHAVRLSGRRGGDRLLLHRRRQDDQRLGHAG